MDGLRLFIRNHHSIFVIIHCPAIRTIRILFTSRKYFWRSIAAHLELLFPKLIAITNIYQLQDEAHRIKEQNMTDNNFFNEIMLKILRSRIWNTVFFFSIWLLVVLQIMCLVGACYEWVQIAWHCTNMLFCCKTVNNLNFLHTMSLSEQIID